MKIIKLYNHLKQKLLNYNKIMLMLHKEIFKMDNHYNLLLIKEIMKYKLEWIDKNHMILKLKEELKKIKLLIKL